MGLLTFLAESFIRAFGITEPSPDQQKRVSLLLGGFLLAIFVVVLCITGFLLYEIHRGR